MDIQIRFLKVQVTDNRCPLSTHCESQVIKLDHNHRENPLVFSNRDLGYLTSSTKPCPHNSLKPNQLSYAGGGELVVNLTTVNTVKLAKYACVCVCLCVCVWVCVCVCASYDSVTKLLLNTPSARSLVRGE